MKGKFSEKAGNAMESLNDRIADSWFGRYFRLDGSGEYRYKFAFNCLLMLVLFEILRS